MTAYPVAACGARRRLGAALACCACLAWPGPAAVAAAGSTALQQAAALVEQASMPSAPWSGPRTGPSARPGRTIAVLAEDLRNGGVLGVSQGIREAAKEIGWTVHIHDATGTVAGRRRALEEALASEPDGLVICGSDAVEMLAALRERAGRLPPIVGWHAASFPGRIEGTPVAMNVTTDPLAVARTAASAAVVQSGGHAGVVIFTDSRFRIATAKAAAMAEVIRRCAECRLLEVRDVAISDSAARMPEVTRELLSRHGRLWTHALAINDIYFDYAVPTLVSQGVPNAALNLLSAGDGSAPAFLRIRAGSYQTGTVAEPLNLQGWQVVDELNRLMNRQPVSGFIAPVHLVTGANVGTEGGARQVYDPASGYREAYLRIWNAR